jgi:hypothetical protein
MAMSISRIVTLGLPLVMSSGIAGRAMAQSSVIPPPLPWTRPQVDVTAPDPNLMRDCDKHRGPIRSMFHRAHCKRCLEEKLLGFREEFNEWPLGAALYANGRAEVANGEAARMTFYHYDFVDGTSNLNLRGADKMQEIRAMLPTNFAPVVVERTPDQPKLAEARRAMLVAELSRDDFPVPAQRVVIGKPVPIGRTGGEAAIISLNQVGAVLSGTGFRTASGGGGPTGFSGGNMSGAAMVGGGAGGMGGGMMGGGGMGGGMMP